MEKALYLGVGLLAIVVEHLVNKITAPLKEHWPKWSWDLITPTLALALSLAIGNKAGLNVFTFIPGLFDWSGVMLTSILLWFGAEGIWKILKQLAEWALKITEFLGALTALKKADAAYSERDALRIGGTVGPIMHTSRGPERLPDSVTTS